MAMELNYSLKTKKPRCRGKGTRPSTSTFVDWDKHIEGFSYLNCLNHGFYRLLDYTDYECRIKICGHYPENHRRGI